MALRHNAIIAALVAGAGAGAALWTPNANAGIVSWMDATTLADGTVASWQGADPYQTTFTATGTINKASDGVAFTGTQYMTRSAGVPLSLKTRTAWPDSIVGSNGPGIGPTCTGLCPAEQANRYWGAFHGYTATSGAGSPGVSQSTARIVKFDFNPTTGAITVLQTIDMMALYGYSGTSTYSVQGISRDRRTGYLWCGFIGNGKAVCVDPNTGANGTSMTSLDITAAFTVTSVAVDPVGNRIWCLEQAADGNPTYRLAAYDMTSKAEVVAPFTTNLNSQDSMFWREADSTLYVSGGNNGSPGYVRVYYAATAVTPKVIGTVTLPSYVDAIEGIVYDDATGCLLVNNDAGYHIAGGEKNELFQFKMPAFTTTKAEMGWAGQMTAVAAAKGVWLTGDPLNGGSMGFGMCAASATSVQVIANTGTSGTTQRALYVFTVPSLVTAPRTLLAQWDTVAGTCRLWCDGVEITTVTASEAMSKLVGPLSVMSAYIIANSLDNLTRQMTGKVMEQYTAVGVFSDVDKANGGLAWKAGAAYVANLPGGHPYKSVAPTV